MIVSVVSLTQPNSREWHLLYMLQDCVCVLSRYLSPVVENGICYMSKCLCVLSRYLVPIVENGICYMLNVFECCLVISVTIVENGICYILNVMCLLSRYLSPSSRKWHLLYVK